MFADAFFLFYFCLRTKMEWIRVFTRFLCTTEESNSEQSLLHSDVELIPVVFDMETGDPDDILSLYLLLGHPRVNLKAVTVHPGSPDQIGLIQEIIADMKGDASIPVGYHNIAHKKKCVSAWYTKNKFSVIPSTKAVPAGPLLLDVVTSDTVVITGGPLTNLASAIDLAAEQGRQFCPRKIVVQGGFAGCNVVAPEDILKKFQGMESQPTYNLNGNIKAAKTVLSLANVPKYFVSKNVCHRITYGVKLAERCLSSTAYHVQRLVQLLEHYQGREKKLHDPFAVCCALSPDIVKWRQVTLSCIKEAKGYAWRSDAVDDVTSNSDHNTWVSVGIQDYELFVQTLTES